MLKLGLLGSGMISEILVDCLVKGLAGDARLVRIYSRNAVTARVLAQKVNGARVCESLYELFEEDVDTIVEAATQEAAREAIPRALGAGKDVVVMSCGVLAEKRFYDRMLKLASEKGARIYIPSGGIVGLDGVKAASLYGLDEVEITMSKKPVAWKDTPFALKSGMEMDRITAPRVIFEGTAEEASREFPANVNITVALGLAGNGPDKVRVRIVADPEADRNTHTVHVGGLHGEFEVKIRSVPTRNPKTSFLAAYSLVATIRGMSQPIVVGT